jgi:hypothetical protein
MKEIKSKNNTNNYLLTSGAKPHVFTKKEQSKGGLVTKYNALKHGRYAEKLCETYICPHCKTQITGKQFVNQKELLTLLSSYNGIYVELKNTILKLNLIFEEEIELKNKFIMGSKYFDVLLKMVELKQKAFVKQDNSESISIKDLMEKIRGLDDKNGI